MSAKISNWRYFSATIIPMVLVFISIYEIVLDLYRSEYHLKNEILTIEKIKDLLGLSRRMRMDRGLFQIHYYQESDLSRNNLNLEWISLKEILHERLSGIPEKFHDLESEIERGFNPEYHASSAKALFDTHTELLGRIYRIIMIMASDAELFLSTDAHIFNMGALYVEHYPEIQESVGRVRALVSGIIASKIISTEDLVNFGEVQGNAITSVERIMLHFDFLRDASKSYQPIYECFKHDVEPGLYTIVNFARTMLVGQNIDIDPTNFFLAATKVIDASINCSGELYEKLHLALTTKLTKTRTLRYFILSVSSLGLLVMFGFITDFYRRNCRAIFNLEKSAEEVRSTLEEVKSHRDRLTYEREIVEGILGKINTQESIDHEGVAFVSLPAENISGDLLCTAIRPNGNRHYFLGDFTGHGIAAAVGSSLVSDIIHAMTHKDFAPEAILTEINKKTYLRLPSQIYLAGVFIAVDPMQKQVMIWNFGSPDVLYFRNGHYYKSFSSNSFPLGIVREINPVALMQISDVEKMDHIYVMTDGLTEAADINGIMFGIDNMKKELKNIMNDKQPLSIIFDKVRQYQNGPQSDDFTLLELMFSDIIV